jgi:hypothetical protein
VDCFFSLRLRKRGKARSEIFLARARQLKAEATAPVSAWKKERFSLSRMIRSVLDLEHGCPTGYELDVSNELSRSVTSKWKNKRGEPGHLVPASACDRKCLTNGTYHFAAEFGKPRTDYAADEVGAVADIFR